MMVGLHGRSPLGLLGLKCVAWRCLKSWVEGRSPLGLRGLKYL